MQVKSNTSSSLSFTSRNRRIVLLKFKFRQASIESRDGVMHCIATSNYRYQLSFLAPYSVKWIAILNIAM